MKRHCIVVPLYKSFEMLADDELISLQQLFAVLGKHPICFISHCKFEFDIYVKEAEKKNIFPEVKRFDEFYFGDVNGYNQLLISLDFYRSFSAFDYLLIYQLDAFVFRDELNYWCKMKYDYIGAPWTGIHIYKEIPLVGVGNGGFSLRKVESTIMVLKKLRLLEVLEQYKNFNWKGIVPRLPAVIYKLVKAKKIASDFEKTYTFQEDVFWCKDAPERLKNFTGTSIIIKSLGKFLLRESFNIAPVETACKFSVETNPRKYYKMNNQELPFGCHAWEKYDPQFWKPFIYFTLTQNPNTIFRH